MAATSWSVLYGPCSVLSVLAKESDAGRDTLLTCCEAGCLFLTFVARGNRISVSRALVPAIPTSCTFF